VNEYDELRDEFLATGDARRCPVHPEARTSSDDGMFDAPCYKCEGEMDEHAERWEYDPENPRRAHCGVDANVAAGIGAKNPWLESLVLCEPLPEDVLPF
jgi:hypothetical protein